MTTSTPTSTRFRRAAETERSRLVRRREKLAAQSATLEKELTALRDQMREIDGRIDSLRSLIGSDEPRPSSTQNLAPTEGKRELTGSAIRTTAVRVLANSSHAGAIHYRQWLDLLQDAGYQVGGKRPDAVFLSQITRSPVVKATTKAGVYQLDFEAPKRLGRNLEALQEDLSQLAAGPPSSGAELAKRTRLQEEISLDIRRTHKALTEARESLESESTEPSAQLAA